MSYPLKESYRPGQGVNEIPAKDLSAIAKTLNDLRIIGLRFKKTSSGLGWEIELQVDGTSLSFAGTTTVIQIKDGGVTEAKIGELSVTEGKIGALAVTEDKIGALAVTEGKIGTGAVTENKIGALAVTTGKIAANAVTSAKTTGLTGSYSFPGPALNFTNGLLTSTT